MDVRNCVKCNKLFNYIAGPVICADCRKSLEDKFKEVKLFIRKNPHVSLSEVSEECSVDIRQIRQWVREERLSFSEDSAIGIECEVCGKTIKTGRFCNECKTAVMNNLGSAYPKQENKESKEEVSHEKKDTSSKMRFLNKDKI